MNARLKLRAILSKAPHRFHLFFRTFRRRSRTRTWTAGIAVQLKLHCFNFGEEDAMKCNIARTMLGIILFGTCCLAVPGTVRAQEEDVCSNASVTGKWGFTTNGTVVGIGPRASVGIFTLDGAGNLLKGKATSTLNGSVTDETFSGTYTVNPDCTGKLSIDIFNLSGTKILSATLDLVFDNDARELRAIFTSAVVPNGPALATVITVQARKINPNAGN
jgi:hypothetical protein